MHSTTKQLLIEHFNSLLADGRKERFNAVLDNRTKNITIVLEDIYQSHNISASIRSAECFGLSDVHIIEQRHRYSVNVNITKGASEWMQIHRYRESHDENIRVCYEKLKQDGYTIVATSPHPRGYSLDTLPSNFFEKPVALIFGTEESGLSAYAFEHADHYITIPMYGFTQSLNISVSVAICLYECIKQLRMSTTNWQLSGQEREDLYLSWLREIIKGASEYEARFLAQLESQNPK